MDRKTLESCVVKDEQKDRQVGVKISNELYKRLVRKWGKDFKLQPTIRNLLERLAE